MKLHCRWGGPNGSGSASFQIPLDVPLAIERVDMAAGRLAMRRRIALETLLCLRVNALILQSIRVSADAIGSRFKIVRFRPYFGLHSHTAYHAAAAGSMAKFAREHPLTPNSVLQPTSCRIVESVRSRLPRPPCERRLHCHRNQPRCRLTTASGWTITRAERHWRLGLREHAPKESVTSGEGKKRRPAF